MGVCSSNVNKQSQKLDENTGEKNKESEKDENNNNEDKQTITSKLNNSQKDPASTKKAINTKEYNEEIKVLHIERPKNDELDDMNLINNAIINCNTLHNVDEKAKKEIIKKMFLCRVDKQKNIFEQGNIGHHFYIIKSGYVKIFIKDEYIRTLTKGDFFGELALLHGGERTATATAEDESYLWCLQRENFKKVIEYISSMNYEENKRFVQSIPMLSKFFEYINLNWIIYCIYNIKLS